MVGSTGKRVSLLFAMLNFVALLQYRNLMNRTLQETTKQHDNEWMMLSYQSIVNADVKKNPQKTRVSRQLLPTETNGTSSDAGFKTAAPEIIINATKIASQQRQQQNQRSNLIHSISVSTSISDRVDNSGNFAYVFLIGGAMSEKKGTDYRGGLYGVVVAAHNLRRHGSKADVIVMVQISATTNATRLPELEEMLLQAMNISVVYLPKYTHYKLESFYSLMMEKFRVLQLEEYSRVLYLDADILPLCNLDYMMKLSESGKFLRENVVLAYKGEPASGGFFVLRPNASDYVELVEIIKKTESKYLELEYPHWDPLEVCC
jgi:alpha-N-acetylglucosamine transferase